MEDRIYMNKDEMWNQIKSVWDIEADAVKKLDQIISPEKIMDAIDALANCKGRVIVTGVGTSAAAAKKIAHSLSCVEIPSLFLSPADAVHGGLGVLRKEDVVIAISKGGGTGEILRLIPSLKAKGAFLIGVTEKEDSPLAEASDILLRIKVEKEPCPFNMLATASTMAVIAVFDAIAITLMLVTGYTKEQFAIIHPSGAVGERLTNK